MGSTESITARDVVDALSVPCLYSESRKYPGYCDDQVRWLLTLPEETMQLPEAFERTMATLREAFGPIRPPELPAGHDLASIHVGLDITNGITIRKLYFELSGPSDLVFLATKSGNGMDDTHQYRSVTSSAALSRVKFPDPYAQAARRILDCTDDRVPALVVTSALTARISVDLNFVGSSPKDGFEGAMDTFLRLFGVTVGGEMVRSRNPVSHVSLGCDGEGAPFLTIYGEPRWLMPEDRHWSC